MQFIHPNGAFGPNIENCITLITSSGFARFYKMK